MYLSCVLMVLEIFFICVTSMNSSNFCPAEQIQIGSNTFQWFSTPADQMGISDKLCVTRRGSWVRRRCSLNDSGKPIWNKVWQKCSKQYITPNLTEALYSIYVESYKAHALMNISTVKNLLQRSTSIRYIDVDILQNYFNYVSDYISIDEVRDVLEIISAIIDKQFSEYGYADICIAICSIFNRLLNPLSQIGAQFVVNTQNLLLLSWRPFQTNISGMALYGNTINGMFELRKIYKHQPIKDIEINHQ